MYKLKFENTVFFINYSRRDEFELREWLDSLYPSASDLSFFLKQIDYNYTIEKIADIYNEDPLRYMVHKERLKNEMNGGYNLASYRKQKLSKAAADKKKFYSNNYYQQNKNKWAAYYRQKQVEIKDNIDSNWLIMNLLQHPDYEYPI